MKTKLLFLGLLITLLFNGKVNGQIVPNGNFNNGINSWFITGNNMGLSSNTSSDILIVNSTSSQASSPIQVSFVLKSSNFSLLANKIYNLDLKYIHTVDHYFSAYNNVTRQEYGISSIKLKDVITNNTIIDFSHSNGVGFPYTYTSSNFTVNSSNGYYLEIDGKANHDSWTDNNSGEFEYTQFLVDKIDLSEKKDDHTILGKASFDLSNNSCTTGSYLLQNIQLKTTGTNGTYYTSTNSSGGYAFAFEENGTVTTEIVTEGLSSVPITNTFTSGTAQTETNQDFCVSSSSTGDDVSVLIIPTSDARPGFNSRYRIEYKNTGSTTVSGDVLLNFEDFRMHSPVSIPAANSTSINSLTWNYSGLTPFETRVINVEFINNTPTQTSNPLVGGESFNFTANITPLNSDINQSDNDFNLSHLVVNSYDPNDATILEGSQITAAQATQDLHFRIRFQNTGTASAINVNIKTILDADLDWSTFTPITASDSYNTTVNSTTGEVNFNFPTINLPDSTADEPNSHGWVLFKAKPKTSFAIGDTIDCGADIFFDYNFPIVTNVAQTEIFVPTTTAIPDAAFEQELINLGYDTGSPNGSVPTANISGVTTLYLAYLGIKDLTGIEDFAALENFTFYENNTNLTTVDLTANTSLKKIDVQGSVSLTTFNISGLSNVTSLSFLSSGITNLDVSTLVGLTELQILNHSLLTSINMSNGFNTNITILSFNQNLLLSCVISDAGVPALGITGWYNPQSLIFDTTCSQPLTYVPDDNFEAYLEANSMGNGIANDDKVTTANINTITNLDISNKAISDIRGIEDFTALIDLNVSTNTIATVDVSKNLVLDKLILNNNNLSTIDVSQNTNLKQLWVRQNNLTFLDVSKNTNLEWLISSVNAIQNLDLSLNTALSFIEIHTNDLHTLNLKNVSSSSLYFDAQLNSSLTCIEVDSPTTWTSAFSSQIDNTASFNTNCSYPETSVPDTAFENYLETHDRDRDVVNLGHPTSMGNGIANDGKVFTHRINTVTLLDVSSVGLSILTGLEDFRDLEIGAYGYNNGLVSADFSNNLKLKSISFTANANATSVIFGSLPDLAYIQLGFCNIANIDLTGLPNLREFKDFSSKLTTLDVTSNPKLEILGVQGGILTALDVSANPDLKTLSVTGNQITNLDFSNNPKIEWFNVSNNQLTSLNLKNGFNTLIYSQVFSIANNPGLTCIEVDNVAYSTTNWTNIDAQHIFNTTCANSLTYVPDAAFETYLETHAADGSVVPFGDPTSMGNGTGTTLVLDGYVFTNRINTVTNLNISNFSGNLNALNTPITDLTGIEDFVALKILWCYFNQLSTLDMSQNVNLEELKCSDNQLTSLNVSQNTNLVKLYCKGNQLAVLDVSNNVNLEELISGGNPFTSGLNIYNNTLLQLLNCTNCQLTALDVSQNTNLTSLNVHTNQLKALDVSQNTNLTSLNIHTNQLTSLIVKNGANNLIPAADFWATNNSNLTCIEVSDIVYATANWTNIDSQHVFNTTCANSLTYVPDNAFETYLETHAADGSVVPFGDPTSMGNVTGTTLVLDGYVFTNRINTVTQLNVFNQSITDMTGIEDFIALQVLQTSTNNIASIDVSNLPSLYNLSVQSNPITTIDVSQNSNLLVLDIGSTSIGNLDVMQNLRLESLNIDYTPTATIDISKNLNLKTFSAENVPLTQIDLSQNSKLEYLELRNNSLSTLDFSSNLLLQILVLEAAPVNSLDLSLYNKLTQIRLNNNSTLSQLNLKNTANTNIPTSSFDIINNPSLTCIEVDDVTYSNTNWTNIDAGANFNTDCSTVWTVMTNPTTTSALLAITGLDADNDGNITIAEAAAFTGTLGLSGLSLTDVEGLQAFINVTVIDLQNNNITDFSPLTDASIPIYQKSTGATKTQARTGAFNLEELLISNNNGVQSLDVSKLTKLKKLVIKDNLNLITLSIKNGNNGAITEFNSSNTPNLTCILVDDVNAGYLSSWTKDVKSTYVAGEADCRARVLSINDFDISTQISLYPNPVNDILKITISNGLEIKSIEVLNILGKRIVKTTSTEIRFTNLKDGIYLLRINTNKGVITKKVIKN
ncbi:MAG: Leucine-rich repeat (LRR) protein [Polaribacter sp.]|jgi:Leucine-rich repeat (LRR) protein